MCGRFALVEPVPEIARLFGIAVLDLDDWRCAPARYNIAPQGMVVVVRDRGGEGRRGSLMRWGLVPAWARDAAVGARMFNARLEGVRQRPAYRDAFARRRCLVPASAFYEWRREGAGGGRRQPFALRRADRRPLALAGLWEANGRAVEGRVLESVAVITTAARGIVSGLHERMPLILPEGAWAAWLDGRTTPAEVDDLARAASDAGAEGLVLYPVTARMNSAGFDDPACLEPVAQAPG